MGSKFKNSCSKFKNSFIHILMGKPGNDVTSFDLYLDRSPEEIENKLHNSSTGLIISLSAYLEHRIALNNIIANILAFLAIVLTAISILFSNNPSDVCLCIFRILMFIVVLIALFFSKLCITETKYHRLLSFLESYKSYGTITGKSRLGNAQNIFFKYDYLDDWIINITQHNVSSSRILKLKIRRKH